MDDFNAEDFMDDPVVNKENVKQPLGIYSTISTKKNSQATQNYYPKAKESVMKKSQMNPMDFLVQNWLDYFQDDCGGFDVHS
jgi:hypothetical protein